MILKLHIQVLSRSKLTGFNRSIVVQKFEAWREQSEPYCFPVCVDTSHTAIPDVLSEHEPYLEGYFGAGRWEIGEVVEATDSLGIVSRRQDAFFVIN